MSEKIKLKSCFNFNPAFLLHFSLSHTTDLFWGHLDPVLYNSHRLHTSSPWQLNLNTSVINQKKNSMLGLFPKTKKNLDSKSKASLLNIPGHFPAFKKNDSHYLALNKDGSWGHAFLFHSLHLKKNKKEGRKKGGLTPAADSSAVSEPGRSHRSVERSNLSVINQSPSRFISSSPSGLHACRCSIAANSLSFSSVHKDELCTLLCILIKDQKGPWASVRDEKSDW